jgi:hypothetical protein
LCGDYRVTVILGALVLHFVGVFLPLLAVVAAVGPERWLWVATIAVMLGVALDNHRFDGGRWWHGLFLPVGIAVMDYVLVRSMVLTYWRGGIVWRGTYYPLRELKANRL